MTDRLQRIIDACDPADSTYPGWELDRAWLIATLKQPQEANVDAAFLAIFKELSCPYTPDQGVAGSCIGCPMFDKFGDICPLVEVRERVRRIKTTGDDK